MLPIGTEVTLNNTILGEQDRRRSYFLFDRIINQALIGKVREYLPDGRLWVDFPGAGILLQEHNVDRVEILE